MFKCVNPWERVIVGPSYCEKKGLQVSGHGWQIPVVPALEKLKQKDLGFQASLDYTARLSLKKKHPQDLIYVVIPLYNRETFMCLLTIITFDIYCKDHGFLILMCLEPSTIYNTAHWIKYFVTFQKYKTFWYFVGLHQYICIRQKLCLHRAPNAVRKPKYNS